MDALGLGDGPLAAAIAGAAGELLLSVQGSALLTGQPLGAAGDRLSDLFVTAALQVHRPHDALLSEEQADNKGRLGHDRVWIVDPLDGTREYSEGRGDWAVHVALVVDGLPVHGAVAVPAEGLLLSTEAPRAIHVAARPPRLVVSRTRPPDQAQRVAEALGCEIVAMGSAGAKAAAVLSGEADIYLHAGGQHEWDNCAPVAVAIAAGLRATRLDGSPIRYNQPEPWTGDLLMCRADLHDKVLAALR